MRQFQSWFDKTTQLALPILTIGGFFLTANKMPQYGFAVTMVAQIFWLHASYQSYKKAGQIGILVTTVIMLFVTMYGLYNWWFNP